MISKDIEVICEALTSGTATHRGRVTAVQNFRVTYGMDQADKARHLAEMDEQTKDLARMRLRDFLGRA